jgi:hypothetical protein
MALDSRFVLASDLLSAFFDKDTGEPLANGVITFYKDQARTEPKFVYQISGTPPNYIYTSLGNEITLSATGLMQNDDTGQIIILLYFPCEGTPDDSDGTLELYYVTCYNEDGELQWTREGWPNTTIETTQEQNFDNFAPNGQFLLHNNVPPTADNDYTPGEITEPVTVIAPGGWTFVQSAGSSATDIVTFEPFVSAVSNPAANPKYRLRVECQVPSAGDARKDVCLTFPDVNKFASETQEYTYAFTGLSNDTGAVSAALVLIKNYGTGGDPQEEFPIANVTIPSGSFEIVQASILFGINIGKNIGSDGDDYVQIALRLPVASASDVSLTDFILTPGAVTIDDFPQTPDSEFCYESITPSVPDYNGMDLYLPMKLTASGTFYDDAEVGDVVMESKLSVYVNSLHPTSNRMLADGAQYETAGYSPLGIPFLRLQQKYFDTTINTPIYGTGSEYLTANISDLSPATQIRIATNARGSTSNIADGTAATGFAFATAHTGADYGMTASRIGAASLLAISDFTGVVTAASAGTSGFTIVEVINQAAPRRHIFTVTTLAAAGLAGLYFTWNDPAILYYVWFTVNGAGADPAPGGTGIKVDLLSTYTADEVACFVLEAMSGYQISTVVCNAASTLQSGDYFNFNTVTDAFYAWYKIGGTGTDPAVAGRIGIEVDLPLGTETAAQVATATQTAINSKYFAAPNFQGLFFRAHDPDRLHDVDALSRFGKVTAYYGNEIGLMQFDEFLSHRHEYTKVQGAGGIVQGGATFADNVSEQTTATGGDETRGVNAVLNAAIIY